MAAAPDGDGERGRAVVRELYEVDDVVDGGRVEDRGGRVADEVPVVGRGSLDGVEIVTKPVRDFEGLDLGGEGSRPWGELGGDEEKTC